MLVFKYRWTFVSLLLMFSFEYLRQKKTGLEQKLSLLRLKTIEDRRDCELVRFIRVRVRVRRLSTRHGNVQDYTALERL